MLLRPARTGRAAGLCFCLLACLHWLARARVPMDPIFFSLVTSLSEDGVREGAIEDLRQLVGLQSVSAAPDKQADVLEAAGWLQRRMLQAGVQNVRLFNTSGGQPIVYGDFIHTKKPGATRPTVLIYGHYDVQPADPLDEWQSPPFELRVEQEEGYFYGRGVDDDKGGLLQALHAWEALMKFNSSDTPNVRFLFEGQEEIMSPDLSSFLESHRDLLQPTDFVLSADGRQVANNHGGIALGMRGVVGMEVHVETAASDMHSGVMGGSVPNAALVLAQLLSQLHDPESAMVKVPGFYKGVKPISDADDAVMVAYKHDEYGERKELGIKEWHGEEGFNTLERRWHRPTLEVVGMHGGFTGQGMKTIVPRAASAKLSCRLVPGQHPDDIFAKVAGHIKSLAPRYANVSVVRSGGSSEPWVNPHNTPGNKLAADVINQLTSKPPTYYRDGATIPALSIFQSVLGLQATPFGWGLGDHIHAPNERFKTSMWYKGRIAWALLLHKVAHMHDPPPAQPPKPDKQADAEAFMEKIKDEL